METLLLLFLAFLAAASGCDLPLRVLEGRAGRPSADGPAYVERGLCPFECCVYREWTAAATIPVHPGERDTTAVAFRIDPGTSFRALGGDVWVDTVGRVAVTDTVTAIGDWREPGDERRSTVLQPGDTLEVLGYLGEGVHHVRRAGEEWLVEEFWDDRPWYNGYEPRGVLLRAAVTDWWVEVEAADGRRGWIRMTPETSVSGADACG